MRISDLFDELDASELDALLDLPCHETPTVSVRAVRRHVNTALD